MNRPRHAGSAFERKVADHAAAAGLPWDRAPLRGSRDLLDIQGCLPAGWLVGCKAIGRGIELKNRVSEAIQQNHRAMTVLEETHPPGYRPDVIAVQVLQRRAAADDGDDARRSDPVGRSLVIMEYDDLLRLVLIRLGLEARIAELEARP